MENKKSLKNILEWINCIIIAIILALLFRYYIGTPTVVKKSSMYPTLQENQRLLLNRCVPVLNQPAFPPPYNTGFQTPSAAKTTHKNIRTAPAAPRAARRKNRPLHTAEAGKNTRA